MPGCSASGVRLKPWRSVENRFSVVRVIKPCVLAVEFAREFALLARFDAFRDDLQVKPLDDRHQSRHDDDPARVGEIGN